MVQLFKAIPSLNSAERACDVDVDMRISARDDFPDHRSGDLALDG